MSQLSKDVYFQCRWCKKGLFREVKEYLQHKRRDHFSEFRSRALVVLVERSENDEDDGTISTLKELRNPRQNVCIGATGHADAGNGSLVLRSGEKMILNDDISAKTLLSSNNASQIYTNPGVDDCHSDFSQPQKPVRYVLSTKSLQNGLQEQRIVNSLVAVKTSDDSSSRYRDQRQILSAKDTNPKRYDTKNWPHRYPLRDKQLRPEPKPKVSDSLINRFSAPNDNQSTTKCLTCCCSKAQYVEKGVRDQNQNQCQLTLDQDRDPSNSFVLDPSSLLRIEWAELPIQTFGSNENNIQNQHQNLNTCQFQFKFNFVPHFLSQLFSCDPLTDSNSSDAGKVQQFVPSYHSYPCVRLKRLSLNDINAAKQLSNRKLKLTPKKSKFNSFHRPGRPPGSKKCLKICRDENNVEGKVPKRKYHHGVRKICQSQGQRKVKVKGRPFICNVCGSAFKHQHVLVNHRAIHANETPFKCPHLNCLAAFKSYAGLWQHRHRCQARPTD